MAKKNYYTIEKNKEKIINRKNTNFLDPNLLNKVCYQIRNYPYKIYYPYKDSERNIIYTNDIPQIKLLEIKSYERLTHREIMGALYNMNIENEMFGDIIINNNRYFILIISNIYDALINALNTVGRKQVKLIEADIKLLEKYERKYEKKVLIVSSLRIDTIISRLIGISRDKMKKLFSNNEIYLNYQICNKSNQILKKEDIFSIRKHGKYKFKGINKKSKKNNYIIECDKYID